MRRGIFTRPQNGTPGTPGTNATIRRQTYTLGAFTALASTLEQAVTWTTPMPDTNYNIHTAVSASTASLAGTVAAELKPGTKTVNGCTIMCNSLGVALDAGQILYVTAIA